MPNAANVGNARSLGESRAQALQALDSVSNRLGEILGDVPGDGTYQNENGELVNEEGLPIIDITEPVDDLDTPSLTAATEEDEIVEDNYPEPISKLSPEALAISRTHRDKILDLLEEEETREERRTRGEQQAELQRKREAARIEMQKRMATQSAELEKRRRAKELEKKMAKALVSGLGNSESATGNKVELQPSKNKEKKSVTFADPPSTSQAAPSQPKHNSEAIAWGDVVPARLPEKQSLSSRSRSQPMKMEVVERTSVSTHSPSDLTRPLLGSLNSVDPMGDSDDEPDIDEQSDSTISLESGEEDVVLSAHRHRDLALEYHRRREKLSSSAGGIQPEDLGFNNETTESSGWDNEDVPLEATLAHSPPKPPISKFKAELANAKSKPTNPPQGLPGTPHEPHVPDASSTFGASVLTSGELAKSIKMGKLVDGKLVAGYEEEDEEEREAREEEEIRKLLLKSMEDYSGIAAQVMGPAGSYWAKSKAGEADPSSSMVQPPSKPKPKVSRFKVNRNQSRDPPETTKISPASSNMSTMSTIIESPSFLPPTGTSAVGSPSPLSHNSSNVMSTSPVRSVEREPMTVADNVMERSPNRSSSSKATEIKPQRISRFKAKRSGEE